MEVSSEVLASVPHGNLRVSRASFGLVWSAAEDRISRPAHLPEGDHLMGVVRTCRWLAGVHVPSPLPGRPDRKELPKSPVQRRSVYAMPETIEEEYRAALRVQRMSDSSYVREARAVSATLEWCWRRSGSLPIDMPADSQAS